VIAGDFEGARNIDRLARADLEHEEARLRRLGNQCMEAGAEQGFLRLEAELRLQPFKRIDVRRIGDDEVPALRRGFHALLAEVDVETDARGVLTREGERGLRDVDARDPRVGPLVLHRQSDRAGADADVEDARRLDAVQ
jgi:hypothetical protein